MLRFFIFFAVLLCNTSTHAFSRESINCRVVTANEVSTEGELFRYARLSDSWISVELKQFFGVKIKRHIFGEAVGKNFHVNRGLGVYSTPQFSNEKNWRINVLDKGSSEQSLKVLSVSAYGYVHTQYLQVDLFEQSEKKPFRLVNGGTIYTGFCE